jgi:hypothetical protein
MRTQLKLPRQLDGNLWHYSQLGRANAMHHHAELEFNLVTHGTGLYLLVAVTYCGCFRRRNMFWSSSHLISKCGSES